MSKPTKVYVLWDFDYMDGSMGSMYLDAIYTSKEKADAALKKLHDDAAVRWAKTQAAKMGYKDYGPHAYVKEMEVKE
jgi:hypothetical protein